MTFYWIRYWSIFFFLLFSLLRWLHLYAKIFWNIFEFVFHLAFLQVQRSRMVSPVNFFCRTFKQFQTSKTQKIHLLLSTHFLAWLDHKTATQKLFLYSWSQKEVVCMMALQFAWPVSVKFDHFFFFFYQTTYYTRTNKIKISQMIISSFSKWLPPRFVNKRKTISVWPFGILFNKTKKNVIPKLVFSFMITGNFLWTTEWIFLENWTCCLIHCLKSTSTNSFQIKKYPIFGWILFFVIF